MDRYLGWRYNDPNEKMLAGGVLFLCECACAHSCLYQNSLVEQVQIPAVISPQSKEMVDINGTSERETIVSVCAVVMQVPVLSSA